MFHRALYEIRSEFSGERAFQFVSRLAQYHRVQASPGFREAARYVCSTMKHFGLDAEVLSFPAKAGVKWWSEPSFQEWDCDDAELILLENDKTQKLCSYHESKLSLIQRSAATAPQGIKAGVVYVEEAENPESYKNIDVRGKIVFSRGNPTSIAKQAVRKHGALGIILDNMSQIPFVRNRFDIPDARQYNAFWPVSGTENLGFGFMLTPKQGEMLRQKFAKTKELKVYAKVNSRFYDGGLEVVTACIPGPGNKETVAMAHLCHPQPSANDNASGSATLMETARVLANLIDSGKLPKPLHTIRFLWVPEMTGTYAYLNANQNTIANTISAINLDMVGENQALCKGPFVVEKPPRATPGFGGHLAESILRYMTKEAPNLSGTSSYALFKWAVSPFSGGSDHCIWSDPSIGVACPMLIQWPDKFYHTSEDTPDKVDPDMLKVAGTLTGTYLHFSATMEAEKAEWLATEIVSLFPFELYDTVSDIVATAGDIPTARRLITKRTTFLKQQRLKDLQTLKLFIGCDTVFDEITSKANKYFDESVKQYQTKGFCDLKAKHQLQSADSQHGPFHTLEEQWESQAKNMVPGKLLAGPVSSKFKDGMPQVLQDKWNRFHKYWERPLEC